MRLVRHPQLRYQLRKRVLLYQQSPVNHVICLPARSSFTEIDRLGGRSGGSKFEEFYRWLARLRPLKEELATFRRRVQRFDTGFDPAHDGQTRYFVRFPQLSDQEFSRWKITVDSDYGEGYSRAEFVRSARLATGASMSSQPVQGEDMVNTPSSILRPHLQPRDVDRHPYSMTYSIDRPKLLPEPAGVNGYLRSTLDSVQPPEKTFNGGYGLFRGFISTKVPKRGDLVRSGFANVSSPEHTLFGFLSEYNFHPHTHLIIRYRGDGRSYHINILPKQHWDVLWFTLHRYTLYTRGGPYWTIAKIPFSKFYLTNKGAITDRQGLINPTTVRMISFTLMDRLPGPFSLEIDYIGLYFDAFHRERSAYEKYDSPATVI